MCDVFHLDSFMLYSVPLALCHFIIFGGFFLVVFVLGFAWMRTAILAGGIAVVRSGFFDFLLKDGEMVVSFCSLATGLPCLTALGAKKRLIPV